MVDSGLTHKTLRAIKAIDGLGVFKNVTSSNIIKRMKVNSTCRLCLVLKLFFLVQYIILLICGYVCILTIFFFFLGIK
jgi:hypothetical protein